MSNDIDSGYHMLSFELILHHFSSFLPRQAINSAVKRTKAPFFGSIMRGNFVGEIHTIQSAISFDVNTTQVLSPDREYNTAASTLFDYRPY